jgi:hypothetical protein
MSIDRRLQDLLERERIAEVVNTLFVATDTRDWSRVKACLAPIVSLDMTSVAGGTPERRSPEEIAAGWEAGLRPIDAVHHQIGNLAIVLEGDQATARCYGIAYHYRKTRLGRNTRVFVGSYVLHLKRTGGDWTIDAFKFDLKFVDGNLELEKEPGA